MNQWAFVVAAYVVVALGTVGLLLLSFMSMRRAEADAEAAKRRS
jgi:hypothetical protein